MFNSIVFGSVLFGSVTFGQIIILIAIIFVLFGLLSIYLFFKSAKLFVKLIVAVVIVGVIFFGVVYIGNNFFDAGWLNDFLLVS